MYAPLEYLKQVKNYFLIFNDTVGTQDAINKMVTDCVDNYFDTDSNLYDLWYDYAKHSNRTARIGKYPKVIRDKYEKLGNDVTLSIAKALNSVNERGINGLVSAKYMFDETPYDTFNFGISIIDNIKQLIKGNINKDQLMGPVGISSVVSETKGIENYIYIIALISLSLGVTNLMPFPPLDGGKIVLLLIEAVRRKPLNQKIENYIQITGFVILITLSVFITYNDVIRIF